MSSKSTNAEEDFEFAPIENSGKVNIANHSHGEENVIDHIHTVTVENGKTVSCTCLGHKYGATTKHREAVENNADVLATADPDPLAPVERADECDVCEGTGTHGEVACFACVTPGGAH